MDVFFRWVFVCAFAVLLQACNHPSPEANPEAGNPAQMQPLENGNDVARHLQSRYNETMPNCDNNPSGAPTDCSGLLLRATEYSPQYHSWQPNPATAKWGISFSWLRKDSDFKDTHGTSNGFIVYPEKYAVSNGLTPLAVECIYPQDAWTAGPDRCTSHVYSSGSPAPTIDRCQDQKIYTSDEWLNKGYRDNENQCAFDVRLSRSSRATVVMYALDIRQRSSKELGYRRNEVVIADWSAVPDAKFPIEAFFYKPDTLPGKPAPLSSAQNDQCDFYRTVGKWIPIIRWDGTALPVGAATFSFRAQDQGSPESCKPPEPNPGEDVARHLQSRYDDTATSCPGQQNPSLVSCSGVLMRVGWGAGVGESPWQPRAGDDVTGIGLDWVRHDANATSLRRSAGMVFYPSRYIKPPNRDVIAASCVYPELGASEGYSWRCGTVCQKRSPPVTNAAEWVNRFSGGANQCAFALDGSDAALVWPQAMIARRVKGFSRAMDVIVKAWQGTATEVPVEAFYWAQGDAPALDIAKWMQGEYRKQTGLWIPIIRVRMPSSMTGRMTFIYQREDQGITP